MAKSSRGRSDLNHKTDRAQATPALPKRRPIATVDDHRLRSEFMRTLIASRPDTPHTGEVPPQVIVQFWDDRRNVPPDVKQCISSWSALESLGYQHLIFDDASAADFVRRCLGERYLRAFRGCPHPAMRSDFFRYAFIWVNGGYYVDADDEYVGGPIGQAVRGGGLKLRPLCYDISSDGMVDAMSAATTNPEAQRIFYVDTTPLIAPAEHPVVGAALSNATENILNASKANRDIQTLTGPGNLTATLVRHTIELGLSSMPLDFDILYDWDSIAVSKWPLAYRSDQRNWRVWQRGDA